MRIPDHMSHLPVVKGRPVPFITRWSVEAELQRAAFRDHIVYENIDGYRLPVTGEPDLPVAERGEPQWAMVSSRRSFQAARQKLCHVCGLHLDYRAWARLTSKPGDPEPVAKRGTNAVLSELPVCLPCAEFSLRACPALAQRRLPSAWWEVKTETMQVTGGVASRVEGARVRKESEFLPGVAVAALLARGELWVVKQPIVEVRLVRPARLTLTV